MNKEYLKEKKWYIVLGGVAVLTILSGVFSMGVEVGFHKAEFSRRFGENYYRNFGGNENGRVMMRGFGDKGPILDRNLPSAHGTAGEVLDINAQGVTVMDRDGVEKSVVVNEKTLIKSLRDTIKLSDLKTGDFVTVMGRPNNQGQIEASLVRVMPAPQDNVSIIKTETKKEAIGVGTTSAAASSTLVK